MNHRCRVSNSKMQSYLKDASRSLGRGKGIRPRPCTCFSQPSRSSRLRLLYFLSILSLLFCSLLLFYILGLHTNSSMRAWVKPVKGPREPWRLPGLEMHAEKLTHADLLSSYSNMTFVYSFVNGSEVNHFYRKCTAKECNIPSRGRPGSGTRAGLGRAATCCRPIFLSSSEHQTLGSIYQNLSELAPNRIGSRDREIDELRYSLRSVEQHIHWHRGEIIIVSPGHHPHWVDGARNFLAGRCGGPEVQALRREGQHVRLKTVHQNAILPYGLQLTINSNTIEQHLWRLKNITSMHVYFNDDYFVNRAVDVTDFLNKHGGSVVRRVNKSIPKAKYSKSAESWYGSVYNTELFNIRELDRSPEDFLPGDVLKRWKELGRLRHDTVAIEAPALTELVDTAYNWSTLPEPPRNFPIFTRKRKFASHTPFVYCTNMFRFLNVRYERELAYNSLHNRERSSSDLLMPFVYNAFIEDRPWQASPKFLTYLSRLKEYREVADMSAGKANMSARLTSIPTSELSEKSSPKNVRPELLIMLNNTDGCAPATILDGHDSDAIFIKLSNNLEANKKKFLEVEKQNPLFFNLNGDQTSAAANRQALNFMRHKFPKAIYLEGNLPPLGAADAALGALYQGLMSLPVVVVTSFEEGVCPLVRSLRLALPDHRGALIVAVQPLRLARGPETLAQTRARLGHDVPVPMAVVRCAYNERVHLSAWSRERGVLDAVREASGAGSPLGVELPASCGALSDFRVRGIVLDARTKEEVSAWNATVLRSVLAIPAQTLALEDFEVVRCGETEGPDGVLVLSRMAKNQSKVHWITGASEADLLQTYPLPYPAYEDMNASAVWV